MLGRVAGRHTGSGEGGWSGEEGGWSGEEGGWTGEEGGWTGEEGGWTGEESGWTSSKAWLDFMGVWVTEEEVLEQPGEDSVGQDLLAMELR